MGRFVFIYLTPRQDYFLYTHSNPRKQAHFLGSCFGHVLSKKIYGWGNKLAKYQSKTTIYLDKKTTGSFNY